MIENASDEQLLEQFRGWLQQTRHEAAEVDGAEAAASVPPPQVGLDRLVEEFTALRQEIKLQTRSSRTLEERLEAALKSLGDAAETFRSAPAKTASTVDKADRAIAAALAELDEALDRGRDQWDKSSADLIGPESSELLAKLHELHAQKGWWQRWRTAAYHRQICRQVEEMEEQARTQREALLGALLSGYTMIQQRLARNMASAGVNRIQTVGRPVDPEQMIVAEVVDAEGTPGHVVHEIRRGYIFNGHVLRPAEVRAIRPRFESANSNTSEQRQSL